MMHTDTVSREPKQYIQLNFIDDQKDVRALHAQSAARHRQSMFTGL
jgi:hypothetical protein